MGAEMDDLWVRHGQGGLPEALAEQVARRPDVVAVRWRDVAYTYRELGDRTALVAGALHDTGVRQGDRVALLMRNRIELVELLFGAMHVGAVPVVLNWRLSARELAEVLDDAEVAALVADPDIQPIVAYLSQMGTPAPPVVVVDAADDHSATQDAPATAADDRGAWPARRYAVWVASGGPVPERVDAPDRTATAVQLYTSGTTGRPKGVMLSHGGIWSLLSLAHEDWQVYPDSVLLCALPAFHIGGLGWVFVSVARGATVVLMDQAQPEGILRTVERAGVSNLLLVPALMASVVEAQRVIQADLSTLRTVVYGASPIARTQLRSALEVLRADFIQAYGLTEACSSVTQLEPEDHRIAAAQLEVPPGGPDLLSSCGRPRRGVEFSIRSVGGQEELPVGQVGEVFLRAPQIMTGYWRRPEETAETLLPGGWLRTGDMGYFDEHGYLHLVDRLKDLIISGGENIYPVEIENVLMEHPDVADAAVLGVPSERWGETPKAFVVLRPGSTRPTAEELIGFCRERLARFKSPSIVEFLDQLPRNASGKLLKKQLRASGSSSPV